MQKKIIITVILAYAVLVLTACASGGTAAGGTVKLDQAILKAAQKIEERLDQGTKVALLNFDSPSPAFSEYVLEELSNHLVNGGKLTVVNRRELDLIRQEEQFQLSGEVSEESAQSIGKKLGAQVIVSGSIRSLSTSYRFRVRALAVESAAVAASSAADLSVGDVKVNSLLAGARPVVETPVTAPAPAKTATPSPGLVRVEGGAFKTGDPAQTVTISGFYLSKYEVTQKEWKEVMGNNPSVFKGDNLPVECVSWYDVIEYCNKRSEKEKLTPAYTIDKSQKDWSNQNEGDDMKWTIRWNRNANGYRLPTEVEWEYAARGGNGSPGNYTYAGSNNLEEVGWYDENSAGSTQEVETKKPNGLGLYDMSGNVWEWCWDWYGDNYPSGTQNPIGASSGSHRVNRGGSWSYSAAYVRSALRIRNAPTFRRDDLGFRLVRPAQ